MAHLAFLLLALLLGGPAAAGPAEAKPQFTAGLVSTGNYRLSAAAAGRLDAPVVRVEFDIATRPRAMRGAIRAVTRAGARPLLLAGFHGRLPSTAEARNLGRWAATFGRDGSFWKKRRRHRLPVRLIEFGNETSYRDQYGDTWSDQSYRNRAALYAIRFAQARRAIHHHVGLLAQADDGGTGSAAWVSHMFAAVPRFGRLVAGWTVHPYGPPDRWRLKLRRVIAQTRAVGARGDIPIDVTEYGISSDDGAGLSDNYGWPRDLTSEQAAEDLRSTVAGMRRDRKIGRRLRLFMVYAAHDLQPPGATRDREDYFGVLRHNLASKGAYTEAVRELFH